MSGCQQFNYRMFAWWHIGSGMAAWVCTGPACFIKLLLWKSTEHQTFLSSFMFSSFVSLSLCVSLSTSLSMFVICLGRCLSFFNIREEEHLKTCTVYRRVNYNRGPSAYSRRPLLKMWVLGMVVGVINSRLYNYSCLPLFFGLGWRYRECQAVTAFFSSNPLQWRDTLISQSTPEIRAPPRCSNRFSF